MATKSRYEEKKKPTQAGLVLFSNKSANLDSASRKVAQKATGTRSATPSGSPQTRSATRSPVSRVGNPAAPRVSSMTMREMVDILNSARPAVATRAVVQKQIQKKK